MGASVQMPVAPCLWLRTRAFTSLHPVYTLQRNIKCRRRTACAAVTTSGKAGRQPPQQMLVFVPTHPLVKHWLAVARNRASPPPVFRGALAELGRVLIYEAGNDWLPLSTGQVETPCGIADCTFVDPTKPVMVVPILRAGLVFLEEAKTVLPAHQIFHVGYERDEATLQAREYLNKLPARLNPDDRVLILDPMLATGGTMLKVIEDLVARGASSSYIRVVTAVVAPPALVLISEKYPDVKVYAAMIDQELNEQGYIVPGLGDAGDRAYGNAQ